MAYIDIGLKIFDGADTTTIGCQTLILSPNAKLRVSKGGTVYSVELVDTADPAASRVRIYDGSSVKALAKK